MTSNDLYLFVQLIPLTTALMHVSVESIECAQDIPFLPPTLILCHDKSSYKCIKFEKKIDYYLHPVNTLCPRVDTPGKVYITM